MHAKRFTLLPVLALLVFGLAFQPATASAFSLVSKNGFDLNLTLDMAAGVFSTDEPSYGAGGVNGEENVGWHEAYFKPVFDASYAVGEFGNLYGGFSYVSSATRGDGDPAGFTNGTSDGWESEQAYLGFAMERFASLGIDSLDLSAGEQDFAIGDGFLIMDGEFDSTYGAYWLNPHLSFKETVIARIDSGAVHADVFFLAADEDSGDTELYGANVEYASEKLGVIGASYMTVSDVDLDSDYALRDGMDIYSIRAQGTPFAEQGLENLFLAFEYAHEGGGDVEDVDADAWYIEAGYTLAQLPWSPTLTYKYAFFSGDEDPTDGSNEAFDPLFYSMGRGYGAHIFGEIAGEYELFNSNQKFHMLGLNLMPNDALSMGVLFFDFSLDEQNIWGDPVSSDSYSQEINVYADYSVTDNLFLTAVFGWATPDQAAEDYFGGDEESTLAQVAAYLTF